MAITERYLDEELATGLNDGTSEANAWQSWSAAATGLVAGERLNVKNPSSRFDMSNVTITFSQTTGADTPLAIRGYGSTIGDGTAAQFENLTLSITGTGHNNFLVQDIDILNPGAAGSPCFQATATGACFYNCKAVNNGGSATEVVRCFYCTAGGSVVNCYAEANGTVYTTGGSTGLIYLTNGVAYANVAVFGTSYAGVAGDIAGIYLAGAVEHNAMAVRNVIINKSGGGTVFAGIRSSGVSTSNSDGLVIANNTVHGFPVGINVDDGGALTDGTSIVCNNLITGCPCSISQNGTGPLTVCYKNAFDGNLGSMVLGIDNYRITADPYNDLSTYDLTLNSATGGGLVCRARAGDATGGTLDIGALGA